MYAILDASRDLDSLSLSRHLCSECRPLLFDPALRDVAPYLMPCEEEGAIAALILGSARVKDLGILVESGQASFDQLLRFLRSRLLVRRERDRKAVFFRFYDPCVLRELLPVLSPEDMSVFAGPIEAFHCQGERLGEVISFRVSGTTLNTDIQSVNKFLLNRYPTASDQASALLRLGEQGEKRPY